METMQLQPVRANLIYPNRINKEGSHVQIVKPMEVISTGIISTNPVEAEPISTREGNKLPFIEANTKEVTMQYLKEECITPVLRTMRLLYHTPVSLKLYGKQLIRCSPMRE